MHKLSKILPLIRVLATVGLLAAFSDVIIFHRIAAMNFFKMAVAALITYRFFEPAIALLMGIVLLRLVRVLPHVKIGRAPLMVTIAVAVILTLWLVPKEQVAPLRAVKQGMDPKDVFKAENDARTTLAQMLGGFAVLVGLYFAWTNIIEAKEGQITDRFTKAIDQLGAIDQDGKTKLELRLGGIYALERIARDSERDHWPIMEILTAYVREHAARAPHENSDLKAPTDLNHYFRYQSRDYSADKQSHIAEAPSHRFGRAAVANVVGPT